MIVVSYLSSQLLPRLTAAVNDLGADLVSAPTIENVEEVVQRRPVGVIVLDPYANKTMHAREVARLLRHYPSTPVIAYTQFVPPAMRALALLSRRGLHDTVLYEFDDSRARFSRVLVKASTQSLVAKLITGLTAERWALPSEIATALEEVIKKPELYSSARDMTILNGIPLTTLYRAFYQAGLEPPKKLFMASKVLQAAALLRDPRFNVQDIADRLGYRHPRVLTQHTLAIFNRRPTVLRKEVNDDMLIAGLLAWVRRPLDDMGTDYTKS